MKKAGRAGMRLRMLALSSSLIGAPCFAAGGSYLVDDAAIAPASHCQLESWTQFRTTARSLTSVPACTWGAIEYSAQLAGGRHAGGSSVSPGAKWLFFGGSRVSAALAVDVNVQHGSLRATVAYVASTLQLDTAGRWLVNANLGATHSPGRSTRRILGGGVEFAASTSLTLLAEIFDTAGATRTLQAGVRLPFGNDSIDLVVGRSVGRQADHWVNIGLNLAF